MSHKHWCDYAGHYWDCDGTAVRLFQAEPIVCMCADHGTPMEDGDHSDCTIELLSCPQHRADHMRAMGYEPDYVIPSDSERFSLLYDADGNPIYARCLWCAAEFDSPAQEGAHTANEMAACIVYQELKGKTNIPPLLAELFDEAEQQGDDSDENH